MKQAILCAMLILCLCKIQKNIGGYYVVKGIDFKNSLELNKDGSFVLKEAAIEYPASCNGTWQYLSKDTILLKCRLETPEEALQSGRISNRAQKAIILNVNQIKIDQLIFTRNKDETH